MTDNVSSDENGEATAKRRDEALRRALNTPRRPHETKDKDSSPSRRAPMPITKKKPTRGTDPSND